MDKKRKQELLQRQLGLRHKLKVHESMKQPETHDEIAVMTVAKWEFEDEIQAIDEVLREERARIVAAKKAAFLSGASVKAPKPLDEELQESSRSLAPKAESKAEAKKKKV